MMFPTTPALLLAAAPLGFRQVNAFVLYVYGEGIGGIPVHYADGNAILSRNASANAASTAVVDFTTDTTTGRLIGTPNGTFANPPFASEFLFIPSESASSKQIGFTSDTSSSADRVTDKFDWYGPTLLVDGDNGFVTQFAAKKTDVDGVYDLLWKVIGLGEDATYVSLRSVAPSTDDVLG